MPEEGPGSAGEWWDWGFFFLTLLQPCEYPLCYSQSWEAVKQESDMLMTVFESSVYGAGEDRKSRWPEGRGVERWPFHHGQAGGVKKRRSPPKENPGHLLTHWVGKRKKKEPNQRLNLDHWVRNGPLSNPVPQRRGAEETLSGSHLRAGTWGTLSWLLSTSRIMAALTEPKSCLDLLSKRQWRLRSNWTKHMRWI